MDEDVHEDVLLHGLDVSEDRGCGFEPFCQTGTAQPSGETRKND